MDAQIGLARALVPLTVALHVRIPGDHPSVAALGEERMGSAALVDSQGILLTVNYVVMGSREIVATFSDGRRFPAEITAQDFESGIAVLRIPVRDRPAAILGDSRHLAPGQEVFVLASAGPTVRRVGSGVITDLGPFDAYWEYMLDSAIQTSAFNPGFGGGPLFDIHGRMIGVTSLNLGQVGRFSLAIPVHLFTEHRGDLLRFGRVRDRVRRAWIGFYPQPAESGIVVAGVVPEAPASRCGIQEGDVILAVNFREVTSRQELYQEMWRHAAGEPLRFSILRDGRRTTIEVVGQDRAEFYR
ncbi:MAG: serine protease [candidate division NC10 bacterium]|nr:serine protease [candidate division NC10 bacterium]MBI4840000.1 serine protease [candidate division NC10 bacterium]